MHSHRSPRFWYPDGLSCNAGRRLQFASCARALRLLLKQKTATIETMTAECLDTMDLPSRFVMEHLRGGDREAAFVSCHRPDIVDSADDAEPRRSSRIAPALVSRLGWR